MTHDRHGRRRRLPLGLIALPLVIAACSSSATVDPTGIGLTARGDAPAASLEPSPSTEAASAQDAWLEIELTDVASGDPFTLASLAGQVVAIEPMAIWCTNCRAQQDNVRQIYDEIAAAGVRYISLGVEPNERPRALAAYAERRGYAWTFAQSPTEMSRVLDEIFGPQILAVPSTPLIVLDESGEIVFQDFGFHGPEALLDILAEASA